MVIRLNSPPPYRVLHLRYTLRRGRGGDWGFPPQIARRTGWMDSPCDA